MHEHAEVDSDGETADAASCTLQEEGGRRTLISEPTLLSRVQDSKTSLIRMGLSHPVFSWLIIHIITQRLQNQIVSHIESLSKRY